MIYLSLKFVHILAVIVWLGGLICVGILNLRLARTAEHSLRAALASQNEFLGARVIAPAAGLTLLAGLAIVVVGHLGLPLWVIWELAALVLSMLLGATLLRRATVELRERLATDETAEPEIASIQRRLAMLQGVNLIVLLSAVWAMVFKPML
jgi:uncharacterized membrane protein